MKLTCDIVQDLLPLYEDGVCSSDSSAAVEAHLKTCTKCRNEQESTKLLDEKEILLDIPPEKKDVNSFKKVRRRWAASLLVVLLLLPLLLLCFNQARGIGICFSNIDEIMLAKKFVRHIQKGKYTEAAQMYDFRRNYRSIMEVLNTPQDGWQPNFEECRIGDEVWYMNVGLLGEVTLSGDANKAWTELIYNRHYGILVPKERMEALATMEPGIVSNDQDGYTVNGQHFYPLQTPWGTFLVEDSAIDSFIQSDRELLDYGNQFTLIPEDMYKELEPELLEESQRMWEITKEHYGPVRDMTEAEFCAYMVEKYAVELEEAFSEDAKLDGNTYATAYRVDPSGWRVGVQTVFRSGGESWPVTIDVMLEDGIVSDISLSCADDQNLGDTLVAAIFPSYLN